MDGEEPGHGFLELSWEAPQDTGSSALASYRLLTVGEEGIIDTVTIDADATSHQAAGTEYDGSYAYVLVAVNEDGLVSPPSNPFIWSDGWPECMVFQYTLGPPPNYILHPFCLLPPPV